MKKKKVRVNTGCYRESIRYSYKDVSLNKVVSEYIITRKLHFIVDKV